MSTDSLSAPVSRWIVWLVAVAVFLLKIPLLDWNQGEYTDGIIQLTLWHSPVVFFPPGYTVCVEVINWFVDDLLLAGRLVSLLASSLALIPLFGLAQIVLRNDRLALLSLIFLALSPIASRWSIRVMTDGLFLLLFLQCMLVFWRAWLDSGRSIYWVVFWAGLASLVRYQGFFFIPSVFLLLWKRRTFRVTLAAVAGWIVALLPWITLIAWILFRGFGHTEQFTERASYGFALTLLLYFNMFETFLIYWPWAITHSLFVLGIIGWVFLARKEQGTREFAWFALITSLVFLLVQSAFLSFQFRYLLPLLPFWCIAGAAGIGWVWSQLSFQPLRTVLIALVLANLVVMSSAVLLLQRGAFGDLALGAEYFSTRWENARLLSDEIYREGVPVPKATFFSGRDVDWFHLGREDLSVGDIILVTNVYSDLELVKEVLEQRYTLQVLSRWETQTVPLLPDIMVIPRMPPMTSNPPAMGLRFTPQRYVTVALRLNEKR